jgi:hypothetical protein
MTSRVHNLTLSSRPEHNISFCHPDWSTQRGAEGPAVFSGYHLGLIATFLLLGMVWGTLAASAQAGEQVVRGHTGDQSYAFRMLPPESFPALPAPIRGDLEKRRCLIPQTYEARSPENVIHGAFHEKGSSDWAVLCSQNGRSMLLVFWDSSAGKPAELAAQLDTETADPHNQTSELGYARGIDAASPASITEILANKPNGPFDHDGIKDAHIEKSSVIHYFKSGTWMTLAGTE